MPIEIEAKMKTAAFGEVRERLAACGAKRIGSVLETNTFFDVPDGSLLAADRGLRLRRTRDEAGGGETFILTCKGPQQPGPLKRREEAEVNVDDGPRATVLLNALGFRQTLVFEKRRETWILDRCKVELDELPLLGRFVEIEGPDETTVMQARGRLGMAQEPLIKTSYATMLSRKLKESRDGRREIRFP